MKLYYLNENALRMIRETEEIEIKHPGAFTDWCKSQNFDGVTCECICKALKTNDKVLHKRAIFAYNFGFKKNGKTCDCV